MLWFWRQKKECPFEAAILRIANAAERQVASVEAAQQSAVDANKEAERKYVSERKLLEFELEHRKKFISLSTERLGSNGRDD